MTQATKAQIQTINETIQEHFNSINDSAKASAEIANTLAPIFAAGSINGLHDSGLIVQASNLLPENIKHPAPIIVTVLDKLGFTHS